MMLAQTRMEEPKYGASSRLAAISVASVVAPATSTSTTSAQRPIPPPASTSCPFA